MSQIDEIKSTNDKNVDNNNKSEQNQPNSKVIESNFNLFNLIIVGVLFLINLLNYMDRLIIAGILNQTMEYFDIDDSLSGFIQTAFYVGFILSAPIFGYLGDRYQRKLIIIFGVCFWSFWTFLGSFVSKEKFWLFLLSRSLVGVGEAAFSCVATTLIGDLFSSETRTRMISIFYLALPIGIGLSYIIGSNVSLYFDDWHWALRFTPPIGLVCVILILISVKEPQRGGSEGLIYYEKNQKSNPINDLLYLIKKKTFVFITFGFTFASFVLGGLSFWAPVYVIDAIDSSKNSIIKSEQVPQIFGAIFCLSGILAFICSFFIAPKLRMMIPFSDPLICSIASLISVPTLSIAILMAESSVHKIFFWINVCIALSSLCLSWTMFSDILVNVIHPNKRATAFAFGILVSHLFGDAGSPYFFGLISDTFRENQIDSALIRFNSLKVALYLAPIIATLSSISYFLASFFIVNDKNSVSENSTLSS